jgi:DNA mismatch endonuclease (patch repair protein)
MSKMSAFRRDVFSPSKRSEVMRAVKSKDTAPELELRAALKAHGFPFRIHAESLPGTPDVVFPRQRVAIFVHGCFWHGHDCPRGRRSPKTNAAYWRKKITRNQARDAAAARALRKAGWRVFTVWECRNLQCSADRIVRALFADQRPRRLR